jgi:hypothetical protein
VVIARLAAAIFLFRPFADLLSSVDFPLSCAFLQILHLAPPPLQRFTGAYPSFKIGKIHHRLASFRHRQFDGIAMLQIAAASQCDRAG